jgi:tetratricopeptide (TPR) repeat protein
MRRQLNFKRLLCLLVVLIACATCVHFLHGFQVKRGAHSLLLQADKAEEKGELGRSAEYLNRYLVYYPANVDVLARYGLLLNRLVEAPGPKTRRQYEQVMLVLGKVLLHPPEREDVRRAYISVAMKLERYTEAEESLKNLLPKDDTIPGDGQLRLLEAQCYERTAHYQEAEKYCQLAIKALPDEADGYVAYARLLRDRLGQVDDADDVMGIGKHPEGKHIPGKGKGKDEFILLNPGSMKEPFKAYLARAKYCTDFGKPEQAAKDIEAAYGAAPEEPEVLRAKAQLTLDQKRSKDYLDEARGYLEHSLKVNPKDVLTYQALARLEVQAGRRSVAIDLLEKGIKALGGPQPGLTWDLANLVAENNPEGAIKLLNDSHFPFPEAFRSYLAVHGYVARKDWLEASRRLEKLHDQLFPHPQLAARADILLGFCYEQLGNPDQQYAAYLRAKTLEPASLEASLGVASALVRMGKLDDAIAAYRLLTPRLPSVWLEVARLLTVRDQQRPANERDWREAEAALEQARAQGDKAAQSGAAVLEATVRMWQGNRDAARTVLAKALQVRPKEMALVEAAALLDEFDKKDAEALVRLKDAEKTVDNPVDAWLALARYWVRHSGEQQAHRALAQLAEKDRGKLKGEEQDRFLRGFAEAFTLYGDREKARQLWDKLAERRPNDLSVWAVQCDLAMQSGDEEALNRALDAIHGIEGSDETLWPYERARSLVWNYSRKKADKGALDEASALLERVGKKRPSWSRVPVCAAEIDALRGNDEAAIRNYQRAVDELGNQDPQVILQLAKLLDKHRRYVDAQLVLRNLPQEVSLASPEVQRVTADVSFQLGQFDRAAASANLAALAGKGYDDYLWLGRILAQSPRTQEQEDAEKAFRKAIALDEKKPDAWIALVQALVNRRARDRAAEAVRDAERKLPEKEAPLALAACYQALGELQKAEKLYDAALDAKPNDIPTLRGVVSFKLRQGKWKDAKKYLEKIIVQGSAEDKDDAKRTLGLVLAAQGDYHSSQDALRILGIPGPGDRPVPAAGGTPADQRARALVLALQRGTRQRKEAIRILESLRAAEPLTPEDQFLLAQLYESVGDWPQARLQALRLLASHEGDVVYLTFLTQALVRHGKWNEAQPWLDKLRKVPDADASFTVVAITARYRAGRDQGKEAVAVAEEYVANDKAQPAKRSSRQALAAALLDDLSRAFPKEERRYADAAEAMYQAYVKDQPDQLLALAAFFGRHGRVDDALRVCARAWQSPDCPPENVGLVSVTALQAADRPDEGQVRLVEGWLEKAIAEHPQVTQLLVCRAYLRDVQGHHAEAEGLYREILKRDGRNLTALNNLATLLALRGGGPEALGLIDQAIQVAGRLPDLLDTRAVVNLRIGQVAPAVGDLEEALGQKATAPSYFHQAQAYLATSGKESEAGESWKKAQAAGLKPGQLHPLERPAYDQLLARFGPK